MAAATAGAVLHVEHLQVRRGSFELGPVDLSLTTGLTVLLGRNGAGKSTLIGACVGLHRLRTGTVAIGGLSPYGRGRREAMRRVGLVPQDSSLPAQVTVQHALDYAGWLKGVPARVVAQRVPEILEALAIADLRDRRVGSLSGGERKRASIAAALVHEPEVLVLDEPGVGLDPVQRVGLRAMVDSLARDRCLLLSTHLVEDLSAAVDRVLALDAGRFVFDGSISDLEALAHAGAPGGSLLERGVWRVLTAGAERRTT